MKPMIHYRIYKIKKSANLLRILIILFLLNTTSPIFLYSQIQLPKLISKGMVLQRNTQVKIWGWSSINEKISLTFLENTFTTTANNKGEWQITLPEQKAGGPYSISFQGNNQITIDSIYFGDVWVCSGQSNMEINMQRVSPLYKKEIDDAKNSNIRYFHVPREYDFNIERNDLSEGIWQATTPENVLNFSAVSYFFGLELYQKYEVPIGLINTALGGSPIECWLSEDALKAFPLQYNELQKFKNQNFIDSIIQSDKQRSKDWHESLNHKDEAYQNKNDFWSKNNWKSIELPAFWPEETNGSVWFTKEFELNNELANEPAKLNMGTIVDADSVFVNGIFVGSTTYQYPPRRYKIPEDVLKGGKNTVTVRVINQIGRGGFIKEKPYALIVGDTTIDLKGTWQYKIGTQMKALQRQTFVRWKPGGLYNAMITPLTNYTIKGAIWYQGESNVGRADEYKKLLSSMIACWRKNWKLGDFPFIVTQLPNYLKAQPAPTDSQWARIREAQLKSLSLPNTALTVNIDLGEWNDIHPLNKKDLSKRLALAAQKIAYNENAIVYSGPIYKMVKFENDKAILSFSHIGSGLLAKNGELKEFAIASAEKKFVWAKAKIVDNTIIVWNDTITAPVAVRYAWADNPDKANLYNKENLPASPFRTDDW